MQKKILYDQQGILPGTPFQKDQWKEIATHDEKSIKGFFGEYRFLSNFWPAKVYLDEEEYTCVENAYQAAKYSKDKRNHFKNCDQKSAITYTINSPPEVIANWNNIKIKVMEDLLLQKFNQNLNPDLYRKLLETEGKYLEETNYWGDNFWGVSTSVRLETGIGDNNLGKLLMHIRDSF